MIRSRACFRSVSAGVLALIALSLRAQNAPAVTLAVDASDAPRRIFHIPSRSGAPDPDSRYPK